jgi:hypothetical protein
MRIELNTAHIKHSFKAGELNADGEISSSRGSGVAVCRF